MAAEDRWTVPSTPVVVSLVTLAFAGAVPLVLLGVATLTGWDLVRVDVVETYWFGLGLLAVGSLLTVPYGAVLGVLTLPVAVRTTAGYGTPSEMGRQERRRDHVAGAVLYAGLASFAAGAVFWATIQLPPGSFRQRLGPSSGVAALLVGGLVVAATFLATQLYHRRRRDAAVDDRTRVVYALYAAGLPPAPFAALVVLDWLLSVRLLDLVLF